MRRHLRFRSVLSWYSSHAAPTSSRSLVTVLMDTSARRLVARRLLPSASRPMIWARRSRGSLFISRSILNLHRPVKHKVQLTLGGLPANHPPLHLAVDSGNMLV